ncbi:hypothetical protein ACP6H4_23860 [Vibrio harveyi]|uniref:hypothetical protein n=1 Tax=Vibrio harveyi group TaxID=717610 RepID=UPI00215D2F4E|nr:hypothetical protein [Vibrio parahaemolyticus]MCR9839697.1 hypothetical protein [Vibrio parahaemolyticus]
MKKKKTAYDRFLEERQKMFEEITILVNSDNPAQEIQDLKQNRKNIKENKQ